MMKWKDLERMSSQILKRYMEIILRNCGGAQNICQDNNKYTDREKTRDFVN
jgi:hypothetical protein